MLSRSSWSFIVLAKILPVGVTSNQLNGDLRSVYINFLWIIFDVLMINFAKKRPLKNINNPTNNEIPV